MADDYRDRGAGGRNPDLMPKRFDYLMPKFSLALGGAQQQQPRLTHRCEFSIA